ncbi:acyltransferase [Vibrio vulnificus]|uniref:acyltransferase n=1 Tax=Vibrio vulnificus TaxID=672 RepID=UPI0028A4FFFF|nr:acyltransferase [Vibrio vulnificus]
MCDAFFRLVRNIIFRRFMLNYNFVVLYFVKYVFGFSAFSESLSKLSAFYLVPMLRKFGAKIGNHSKIESGFTLHNARDLSKLIIGEKCYIGKNTLVDLREKVVIGDRVVIAMNVTLLTHLDVGASKLSSCYPPRESSLYIANDSYIGEGTSILMGVRIGECSLVGAKSLVTKSCDGYGLYVGVPAVRVKDIYVKK